MKYQVMPDLTPIEYEALKADIAEESIFFRHNHMVRSEEHEREIKEFCTERSLSSYIAKGLTDSTFFAVWWGYQEWQSMTEVVHPGWEQYVKICTPANTSNPKERYVYFIQSVDGGPIKIGVAYSPQNRLQEIQRMSPVKLCIIGLTGGGAEVEACLHRRFARYRLYGEWFAPVDELTHFISESGSL